MIVQDEARHCKPTGFLHIGPHKELKEISENQMEGWFRRSLHTRVGLSGWAIWNCRERDFDNMFRPPFVSELCNKMLMNPLQSLRSWCEPENGSQTWTCDLTNANVPFIGSSTAHITVLSKHATTCFNSSACSRNVGSQVDRNREFDMQPSRWMRQVPEEWQGYKH